MGGMHGERAFDLGSGPRARRDRMRTMADPSGAENGNDNGKDSNNT